MSLNKKIQELLERAAAGAVPQEPMHTQDGAGSEDLGSENVGAAASANAASAAPLPGSNSGGDKTPPKQGSSDAVAKDEEQLDDKAPGKTAAALASAMAAPGGSKGGDATNPKQGSSDTPTPGQAGMTSEEQVELKAILDEAGIPEAAQAKLVEAFEAAVLARVEAEVAIAQDSLVEAVEQITEQNSTALYESVNSFLNYVVNEWMEQNALAVESGLRAEISESFITGLKTLFTEHYIDVPEDKVDVVVDQAATIQELEAKINESVEVTLALTEENRALKRLQVVERAASDMVATDAEKFAKLVEDVEFVDVESFTEKVDALKTRYFSDEAPTDTSLSESTDDGSFPDVSDSMSRYVRAISASVAK